MHIVIFTGGESPEPELAENFFSWAGRPSLTVAADSGLDTLELYAGFFGKEYFSPGAIVGDMDSISDRGLLEKYPHAKIMESPADKDFSDTELSLFHCANERKTPRDIITLVGGNGGRADHFIGIYETFASDEHADFWICGKQLIARLGDGGFLSAYGIGKKDVISAARIPSFYDRGTLETEGLEWGSDVMRKKGMPSLSNRISKNSLEKSLPVTFAARDGGFLVFLPLGCRIEKFSPGEK